MSKVQALPGERMLFTCKANAIIVPSEYGLSRFATDHLMPLVGLGGKEAIGGHLHVTGCRLVFKAHPINRLRGTVSTPLPAIQHIRLWRSVLAFGVEVQTPVAVQRYVTWSRSRLIQEVEAARAAFGPEEQAQIDAARATLRGFTINRIAETLNVMARTYFEIADTTPSTLELVGLLNFLDQTALPNDIDR